MIFLVLNKTFQQYLGFSFLDIILAGSAELFLTIIFCMALLFLAVQLAKLSKKVDSKKEQKKIANKLTIWLSFFLLGQGLCKIGLIFPSNFGSNNYFIWNSFNTFLGGLVAISGSLLLFLSIKIIQPKLTKNIMEFPILFIFGIWFLQILLISNHLLITLIGFVGFSLNIYVMIMIFNARVDIPMWTQWESKIEIRNRHEASIKYFYLSTFSAALVLFSFSLFQMNNQTTNFVEWNQWLIEYPWKIPVKRMLVIATTALILGFAFKISAFPSQFWAPEVYQGSANLVTAYIILPVKIACFGIFMIFLSFVLEPLAHIWNPILSVLIYGSLIVGALGAFFFKKSP